MSKHKKKRRGGAINPAEAETAVIAGETSEEIVDAVGEKAEDVAAEVTDAVEEKAEDVAEEVTDNVEEKAEDVAAEVTDAVEEKAEDVAEEVTDTAEEKADAAEEVTDAVEEKAEDVAAEVTDAVEEKTEDVAAEVTDAVGEKVEEKPKRKERRQKNRHAEERREEQAEESFVEQKLSESEKKSLHERFRFDWELEENIIEALDEDAAELDDADEEAEPEPIQFKSITFAQAAQTVFGLFLLIFSIIGVTATAFKIYDVVQERKDNTERLEYFADFVMPLVACDSPTFDGASSLNEDIVVTAACWDIVFHPSSFYENVGGSYSVSYIDVDRRIAKLFGPGLTYTHKTVGDVDLSFEYDEETGMYTIPAYPRSPAYYPEVTEISETDAGTEITVCYHLPITNWIDSIDTVEKTMIYTLVPTETDYNVVGIRIGEINMSEAN